MKSDIPKVVKKFLDEASPDTSLERRQANQKSQALIQKVWDWITHVLPKPTEEYNGMPPCPYARVALSSGNVMFHVSDDITSAIDIKSAASDYGEIDHILIWTNPSAMTPEEMIDWLREQNRNHFGIWLMGMHPDHEAAEQSVWESLNMDDFAIILVQQLLQLDTAHRALLKTPYYYGVEEIGDLVERRMCANDWYEKERKEIRSQKEEDDEENDEEKEEVRH